MGELFGPNLLQHLLLALGAALVVGNVVAIFRPPPAATRARGDLREAPMRRSMVMIGIGLIVVVWTVASLL